MSPTDDDVNLAAWGASANGADDEVTNTGEVDSKRCIGGVSRIAPKVPTEVNSTPARALFTGDDDLEEDEDLDALELYLDDPEKIAMECIKAKAQVQSRCPPPHATSGNR
jgi:hypothetical protein